MKNKKGFTLIELLAIIVILAVIAVITVPIILNIIDNAEKGSAQDSALGYKDALQKYYATKSVQNPEQELPSGYMEISELPSDFTVSGENPSDGWVKLKNGIVEEYSLKYKDYVVTKYFGKDAKATKRESLASIVQIPDEYQEVEYLESTGTQYVDTGYIPNSNTKIEIQFMAINNSDSSNIPLFGARTSINSTDSYTTFFKTTTGNGRIDYSTSSGKSTAFPSDRKITFLKDKEKNYIDGELKNSNSTSNFFGTYSLYLNNVNTSGASYDSTLLSNKLYYTMIWNNGNLVRNFVPVIRKSDNKPGLLDLANLSNNLIPEIVQGGVGTENGTLSSSMSRVRTNKISITEGTTYTIKSNNLYISTIVFYFDDTYHSTYFIGANEPTLTNTKTFTVPSGVNQVAIGFKNADNTNIDLSQEWEIMLNEGTEALPYEPYKKSFYTNDGTGEFIAGPEI